MAVVSLFANGEAIALDATTDVAYTKGGQVSTATIFEGSDVSDNYRPSLPEITLNGVVSATKTRASEQGVRTPKEFREMVDNWINSKYLISLYGTYDGAIPNVNNMVISSYNVTRDGQRSDGLSVSMTLKQLDISNSVQKTSVTIPKSETNGLTSKPSDKSKEGNSSDNTTKIKVAYSAQKELGTSVSYKRDDGKVIK